MTNVPKYDSNSIIVDILFGRYGIGAILLIVYVFVEESTVIVIERLGKYIGSDVFVIIYILFPSKPTLQHDRHYS